MSGQWLSYLQYRQSLESCKNRTEAISVGLDGAEEKEDDEEYFYWANSQQNWKSGRKQNLFIFDFSTSNGYVHNIFLDKSLESGVAT